VRVRWTDQAFERLAQIEAFIAQDDPKAGERLVDRLIARGEALADQPYLGRRLPVWSSPGSLRFARSRRRLQGWRR
jgi:toxin ParE1/3/4